MDTSTPSSVSRSTSTLKVRRKLPHGIVVCMSRANSSDSDEHERGLTVVPNQIKKLKIEFPVFKLSEYARIHENLSSAHLKLLCTKYGLKCGGTKLVLALRARTHCMESHFALRIERVYRGHIARTYLRRHAHKKADDYVNDTDFYTMDEFGDLPHYQIFTFQDKVDHKLYRFNMASFFKLMKGAFTKEAMSRAANGVCCEVPSTATNPYTRMPMSIYTVRAFFNKLMFCRMMRLPVYTDFKEDELTPKQVIDARILELFQDVNKLGNYSDSDWFSSLKHPQYIWFIQELYDIWAYRAELSMQTKMQICPPYGHIFPSVPNGHIMLQEMHIAPFQRVRDVCISTCERLVRSGVTADDRYLGASYVLSALTLVSPRAREAMPWLYQSVAAGSPTAGAGAGATYTYTVPVVHPVAGNNMNIMNNMNNLTFINNFNNLNNLANHLGGMGVVGGIVNDDLIDDAILYNILTMISNNGNGNNGNGNNGNGNNGGSINANINTNDLNLRHGGGGSGYSDDDTDSD